MTTLQTTLRSQADLPYRCEFAPDETDALTRCVEEHGFAVVKDLISSAHVEELKDSVRCVVNPDDDMGPGQSRTFHAFIEHSPPLARLLENQRYLDISRRLLGDEAITLHRTAAIIRNPGSSGMAWHTDWSFPAAAGTPPRSASDVLNNGEGPSGLWFYLTGSNAQNGGIAIIPDSHTPDWPGPRGYEFTDGRHSFHRQSEAAVSHHGADVPGAISVETQGSDLIVFAARTYHAALSHQGDEPRLSCAVGFRAGQNPWPTPWLLPASARRFIESVPPTIFPIVEHYTGIVPEWKPAS